MEIASLATKMSFVNTMEKVSVSMMDKALDQMELMGEQLAMMIAATEVTGQGGNFDISL